MELYHGENLIDFRVVGEDGRYELSDVPLFYGFNVLRRVFHGPQGQRREKVERLWIGPELIRAGRSHYRFAVLQPSRGQGEHPQLGARGQGEHPQLGATALAAADAGSGGEILPGTTAGDIAGSAPGAVHRYFFELERGLRHNLSVGIRLDSLPLADGRHTYTGLRLWGSAKGFLGGVDLVADNRGGWAGRFTAQGRLAGMDLQLAHEEIVHFFSERTASIVDPPVRHSSLRLDGRARRGRLPPFTYRWTARHEQRRSGAAILVLAGRLGLSLRSVALSSTFHLSRRRDASAAARREQLGGSLLLSGRWRRLSLRGALQYTLRPERRWTAVALTADWHLSRDFSTRLRLRRSLATNNPF